ncbi:MAG: hypothetical protein JSR33_02530 [Proteobacteria bacterium]|nr:hypothetical protein [Pseudomonadota bacterium]
MSDTNEFEQDYDDELDYTLSSLGIPVADWQRRVSASDVVYLLDQCPFLEIRDAQEQSPAKPKLIRARSGWKIHDLGNQLSSSPGLLLFGHPKISSSTEEDGTEGGTGVPKAGTIINQAVITAFEMVELALQRGWSVIKLIDGHPLMAWAAWVQSLDSGIGIEGYVPSAKDFAKLQRLKAPRTESGIAPKMSR